MSESPYPGRIRLLADAAFILGANRAARAVPMLNRELAALDATWEPHDWRDFA